MSTDRIVKRIVLRAPRSRVWRALSDAGEFGAWFKIRFDAPFAEGARVQGRLTEPGYEGALVDFFVERLQPETLFSYRWHPFSVDPAVDYAAEPLTLVEFRLEEVPGGTALTVTESGFDRLPAHRRAEALRMNEQGWAIQAERVARHVAG